VLLSNIKEVQRPKKIKKATAWQLADCFLK
jgi:hypothetical protein